MARPATAPAISSSSTSSNSSISSSSSSVGGSSSASASLKRKHNGPLLDELIAVARQLQQQGFTQTVIISSWQVICRVRPGPPGSKGSRKMDLLWLDPLDKEVIRSFVRLRAKLQGESIHAPQPPPAKTQRTDSRPQPQSQAASTMAEPPPLPSPSPLSRPTGWPVAAVAAVAAIDPRLMRFGCGTCENCLDKKCFGGPGKKRKACQMRGEAANARRSESPSRSGC